MSKMDIVKNFLSIFDIESLIRYGGLLLVFLAVYGQTGLFFCFFLPSGALMFTAGVFVATGDLHQDIFSVCCLLILASVLGNMTGYWFGWKTGPLLYRRKESRFFRQEHLKTAESFYKKYGGLAVTAGFFFPIIRTFAPIVAGMIRMNFRRFLLFSFAGSVLWILSFVLAGYLIGSMPFLKPYLKYIIIGIIVLVTIPILIRVVREFKKREKVN
jgi:membrane-associated protein